MGSAKFQLKKAANILIKSVGFSNCTYISIYMDVYMCWTALNLSVVSFELRTKEEIPNNTRFFTVGSTTRVKLVKRIS